MNTIFVILLIEYIIVITIATGYYKSKAEKNKNAEEKNGIESREWRLKLNYLVREIILGKEFSPEEKKNIIPKLLNKNTTLKDITKEDIIINSCEEMCDKYIIYSNDISTTYLENFQISNRLEKEADEIMNLEGIKRQLFIIKNNNDVLEGKLDNILSEIRSKDNITEQIDKEKTLEEEKRQEEIIFWEENLVSLPNPNVEENHKEIEYGSELPYFLKYDNYIEKEIKNHHEKHCIICFFNKKDDIYTPQKELCIFNYNTSISIIYALKKEVNFKGKDFCVFEEKRYQREYVTSQAFSYTKNEYNGVVMSRIIKAVEKYNKKYKRKDIPSEYKDINIKKHDTIRISVPLEWFNRDKIFEKTEINTNIC